MGAETDTQPADAVDTVEGPFFRRLDWSAFWTATLLTFAVYFYTLAPTVTLEDSGELAVAGDFLGVPHPPGYPIWSLICWFFTKIFAFVPFRGQPNPAWSIGLVSAVFGALAAGVTGMLICRSGADLLRQTRGTEHKSEHHLEDYICWTAGVVGSLLFALSPVMWSQSVIVEVYSLNAFFLMLIFLLTYWWMSKPTAALLAVTAFVFGLGLTNYQVLLLAALPLVIAIMLRDMQLFRSFIIVGFPYLVVIGLMKKGYLPPISHPLALDCFVYMALNFLVLLLAWWFLPRGKTIAFTILMAELGISFYAYMPIVSDLRNPPMNWGYPRTWEGFLHAITRGQYERIAPTDAFSRRFIHQLGSYLSDLRGQFTLPLALLGFLPFTVWRVRVGRHQIKGLNVAIVLSLLATAMLVLERGAMFATGGTPWRLDKLFVAGVILSLLIGGLTIMANQGWELWDRLRGRKDDDLWNRIVIGLVFVAAIGIAMLYAKTLAGKIGELTAPLRQEGVNLAPEQVNSLMLQAVGLFALIIVPFLLLAATAWLIRSRHGLHLAIDARTQKWVVATLFGFLVMSLMLIVLANPKGDVQDNFIQRVKFISSHALYAIWIGYGLVFGLAWVDTLFRGNRLFNRLGLLTALCMPLIPLLQNGYNYELIRLSGSAEQNGHDFGWQFGNYQLRGAEAILEELDPDEEPLPNPAFPPAMEQGAIFYGGTDPGRFVPTYMIYSARVREDVYLITQNALADNTYMNVMRDLYGDRIWIPAQQDSAKAFRIFVDEVQAGTRQAHADLQIENGRVQVSGALGVMEINGILARMIFDRNKYRHAFFVEESYVIGWMYPFLTPHGLIMKINADATPMSPEIVRDDLDFWDWYTRRLHGSEKFRRDVVARKSFSKLRSAIGGLFANRGLPRNAEEAFHQARTLYPLSPEANFRLVQEVLLREGRFDEATHIMEEFGHMDRGNDRVPEFIDQLNRIQGLDSRIRTLEEQRRGGNIDIQSALDLADAYRQAMHTQRFLEIVDGILATPDLPPNFVYQAATMLYTAKQYDRMDKALETCLSRLPEATPPELYLNMARMYADAKMPQKMVSSLQRYLELNPGDWKAWLDMAYIFQTVDQQDAARRALTQARQIGGAEADALIRQDSRFAPLLQSATPVAPSRNLMEMPGVAP